MKIQVTEEAEFNLADELWFYERQAAGLGDYFRSPLISDIDSLVFHAGIHERGFEYHHSYRSDFSSPSIFMTR